LINLAKKHEVKVSKWDPKNERKKSNRAVPYLYYEVEKKERNSKLLPQTKCPPILML